MFAFFTRRACPDHVTRNARAPTGHGAATLFVTPLQVNVLMWAVQPALAGALNREFRHQSKEDEDEDRLYPVVLVRPLFATQHAGV